MHIVVTLEEHQCIMMMLNAERWHYKSKAASAKNTEYTENAEVASDVANFDDRGEQ